jgi:hypothetical protein
MTCVIQHFTNDYYSAIGITETGAGSQVTPAVEHVT